ncbi:uracil-DNA glycosylase [Glutamicibacter sp. JC586]|uniref:uracil-DNA glycosylase n=1 Tax=Glutamicibacter sp. JC586 TaxID=2590552 RepID=UPI001F294921|nr:uracil-DNA glycosylase [Glutamicibacter sp. JC586]
MDEMQQALFDAPPPPKLPVYVPEEFPFFHGAQSMSETGFIASDWVSTLSTVDKNLRELAIELAARSTQGEVILPEPKVMFRALTLPLAKVKVLIIGQDPYPTPGHANGLAFAANKNVRPLPRSLNNIYTELHTDLGITPAPHPDLSAWQDQGVLLLNQVLTVAAGHAAAHQKIGWSPVLEAILTAINDRATPPVSILWGNHAQKHSALLSNTPQIRTAHPSPLSASRGFFGSKPFSETNRLLSLQGQEPINWSLPLS